MLANYFRLALRNLLRNKSYAVINVLGLSIGTACCLAIFLVVRFELSYDSFQSKRARICRLVTVLNESDVTRYTAGIPFPVADGLRLDFPQLEAVAAIDAEEEVQMTALDPGNSQTERKFKETRGVFCAEPQIFDILDIQTIAGDPRAALADPSNAVLTKATAERYFGDWRKAIGRSVLYRNRDLYRVAAVIEDYPANSDFPFKVLLPYASLRTRRAQLFSDWVSTDGSNNCYVLLPATLSATEFNSMLPAFNRRHKPQEYWNDRLEVQTLSAMHFDSRIGTYSGSTFSKELITALILVAVFLLIAACVNFINLATAQASNRSREIGVRKVLGSHRSQLMLQFLSETAVISAMAIAVALALMEIAIPLLSQLLGISLQRHVLGDPGVLAFLLILYATMTVLSGMYPALILSGFSPMAALKSRISSRRVGGISLRRGLVVLQFVISQVLIIGMLVVVRQMNYFKNASLGFDKDAVVLVPVPGDSVSQTKIDALKSRLLGQPGVSGVSFSEYSPSDNDHWSSDFMFDRSTVNTKFSADLKWADVDYFKTYNIQFAAGRPYLQSDTVREFVVNETLVHKLGILNPQDILGKRIRFWNGELSAPVVGVVKDFNSSPLQKPMMGVVLGSWKDNYRLINIKIQPARAAETLATIEKLWNETYPAYLYEYQFLDNKIDRFYKKQTQLSEVYQVFAGIAVFISCLGLYGLVSFMAVQRVKEIGIRKVLGASVGNVIMLLSREFTLLIGVAFAIAAPTAYFILNGWLQDFAYRIDLGAGLFLLAAFGTIAIAWMTVGYRAIRAALANPVDALRYE